MNIECYTVRRSWVGRSGESQRDVTGVEVGMEDVPSPDDSNIQADGMPPSSSSRNVVDIFDLLASRTTPPVDPNSLKYEYADGRAIADLVNIEHLSELYQSGGVELRRE